jgi:hypothetical protein
VKGARAKRQPAAPPPAPATAPPPDVEVTILGDPAVVRRALAREVARMMGWIR